ncbi:hypothetical protein Tsubulata_048307 [Turnera subulata]|uniref:DUF4283 domain-containing protein n=1 Tax=Turnera subulata TaxID=218843 RepID=A0A9Q0GHA1_9ROSI|nr:hypothetical protein Tsubulata_043838 [Turnera subulata]KAJ4849863.1 hypothetical protein Tsubulata_048307 [Turnera subulata]
MAASSSAGQIDKGKGIVIDPNDEEVVLLDDLNDAVVDPHFYLLARVHGSKHLKPRAFTNVMRGLWSPTKGEPWSFDKRLIVIKQVSGDDYFHNAILKDCPFWVPIYDVSISFQTEEYISLIISRLGRFCGFDERGPLD